MIHYGSHTYGTIIPRGEMNDVFVGKYCQLAINIIADCGFTHNTKNISTYPFHAWMEPNRWPNNNVTRGDIHIGNDVWIGEDVIIMSGVSIGDGCIIGARSIITKDIVPYSLAVGTDRIVRKRFTKREIDALLQIKWWDLPDSDVEEIAPILHGGTVDELVKTIKWL